MKYSLSHSSIPHSLSKSLPGLANMTCLVFSLMARATLIGFLDVVRPHAEPTSPSTPSHQAGIHGYDAFTRQCSATTSVELRSILHNTDSRAHGILRRSPLLQQRIASSRALFKSCSTWARRSGVSFLPRLPHPRESPAESRPDQLGRCGPSTEAVQLRSLISSPLHFY